MHSLFVLQLDIDRSLEPQGPFDLILHKCTLLMVDAEDGDEQSIKAINNIKVCCTCRKQLPKVLQLSRCIDNCDEYHTISRFCMYIISYNVITQK